MGHRFLLILVQDIASRRFYIPEFSYLCSSLEVIGVVGLVKYCVELRGSFTCISLP